ncbi:hypothetical protein ACS0TY_015534 [Phlomoides rotata]
MKSFVRISALLWAVILVAYALFVMRRCIGEKVAAEKEEKTMHDFFPTQLCNVQESGRLLVVAKVKEAMFASEVQQPEQMGIGLVTMSTPLVLANATGTCKKYEQHCVWSYAKSHVLPQAWR